MKRIFAFFLFPIALIGEIQVGTSEADLLKEKGKPASLVQAGSNKIYSYNEENNYRVKNGIVTDLIKNHAYFRKDEATGYSQSDLPSIVAESPEKWGFEFKDISFVWEKTIKPDEDKVYASPRIKYSIKNISTETIDRLVLKFVIYESDQAKIFDEITEYVIGASDAPLEPGVTSRSQFSSGSIGFLINKVPFYTYGSNLQYNPRTLSGYDTAPFSRQKFRVIVYARGSKGDFSKFSEFVFSSRSFE